MKLITGVYYQVHMAVMSLRTSLDQRSRSAGDERDISWASEWICTKLTQIFLTVGSLNAYVSKVMDLKVKVAESI